MVTKCRKFKNDNNSTASSVSTSTAMVKPRKSRRFMNLGTPGLDQFTERKRHVFASCLLSSPHLSRFLPIWKKGRESSTTFTCQTESNQIRRGDGASRRSFKRNGRHLALRAARAQCSRRATRRRSRCRLGPTGATTTLIQEATIGP